MGWTAIADTAFDAESAMTEGLWQDVVENTEYNHDNAVRGGTHTVPVRLALARGTVAWNDTTDASGDFTVAATVTFSSDADDGDPNFDSVPVVLLSLEEDTTGAPAGTAWPANSFSIAAYLQSGSLTAADFDWEIFCETTLGASQTFRGILHWMAIGPVTSGE